MVNNDFAKDCRKLLLDENKTQTALANEMGISKNALFLRMGSKVINKGFEELIDALGYDIVVTYVKKG